MGVGIVHHRKEGGLSLCLSTTVTTMEYVHTGGGYSVSVKSVWVCVCMHIFLGEHIGACLYKLPQND